MSRLSFGFGSVVCAALLSAVASLAHAQQFGATPPGPVPSAIRAAKKVFVSNGGSDIGLFPRPFSGDPNRAYNQFYAALKAAGQFELVSDPGEADLVLELQLLAPSTLTAISHTDRFFGERMGLAGAKRSLSA